MILRSCLLLCFIIICGCQSTSERKINNYNNGQVLTELGWMLGKWKREDTGELELWSKRKDSFYGGMMVELNDQETAVIKEVLSLEGRKDGIYYGAKVKGRNNDRKVEFKMSNQNFDNPKFSNESHDYPQHISYMKIGTDKIKVELEGNGNDKSFYYVREM